MSWLEAIEIAHLNLRYAHTRIRSVAAAVRMAEAIERFGQSSPVLVVPGEVPPEFILIDGYLRVEALKRCGQDMVHAQIWPDKEAGALIHVLAKGRSWDIFEQAALLKELYVHHELTQAQIARLLGKDKSWVSRRISFLTLLPDEILAAVRDGSISSWSAHRVLAPLARANGEHAAKLADNLKKESLSTRDLALFFDHYKKTNRNTRQNMVDQPHLFLKALETTTSKKQAKVLSDGPEGRWVQEIKAAGSILTRLINQVPVVLYAGQSQIEKSLLLTAFDKTWELMITLEKTVRGASP
ncbi:MAG: ParB/RepB/Spo0J family partition protein [Desulfatirhabdiaceae bacterium]|jgi:ParB-like chromosome segregation protein Spo0J|nr:ParB/RepB/Spo0J family partition protein [Desulfatirhabdiaceae bacterium]